MHSAAVPLPRLTLHGLTAPAADDARRLLASAASADTRAADQVWAEVCEAAGLSTGVHLLTVDQAEALAEAMLAQPASVGVAGRDFRVRVRSYRLLAEQEASAGPAPRPFDPGFRSASQLIRSRLPDDRRLAAIAALGVFSEANKAILDDAAGRAAQRIGGTVGLVTLVTEGAQNFVGSHGLEGWMADVAGTPVEWSFCATTVRRREAYVVQDATVDVHQWANPLVVTGELVSYSGVPLLTLDGHALGALCVLNEAPLSPRPEQLAELAAIAAETVRALEAGNDTRRDPLGS